MDLNVVFAKTAAGEQAVQERTRLVQRNLRNVLIMVDGHCTVQELCDKVGKAKVVESALEQLLRDGYIQPALEQDSVWDKSVLVAESLREAASEKLSALRGKPAAPVVFDAPPESGAIGDSPFAAFTTASEASSDAAAAPPVIAAPAAGAESRRDAGLLNLFKGGKADKPKRSADDSDDEGIDLKALRRGSRRRLNPYAKASLAAVALILMLVAVAVLFPYDVYRAEIETGLSGALGKPVRVGAVHTRFSPTPTLVIEQLRIGEIEIAEVRASPSVGSIFADRRDFREVALSGIRLSADQLSEFVPGLFRLGQVQSFVIRKLSVSGVEIALLDWVQKDLEGGLAMRDEARKSVLSLKSSDDGFHLDLPIGDSAGVALAVEAIAWKPEPGSPFVVDAVTAEGMLAGSKFVSDKLSGRLFDGFVQGQLQVDWSGAGVELSGEFGLERASATTLGAALGVGRMIEGEMDGRVRMSAKSETVSGLREKMRLEGDFNLQRGTINGIDLVEVVRRAGIASTQGGSTRLDQLSGRWLWDGQLLRISALQGSSSAFQATGGVVVGKGRQVQGNLDVRLKGSAELRVPLAVSGTANNLQVQAGRR